MTAAKSQTPDDKGNVGVFAGFGGEDGESENK